MDLKAIFPIHCSKPKPITPTVGEIWMREAITHVEISIVTNWADSFTMDLKPDKHAREIQQLVDGITNNGLYLRYLQTRYSMIEICTTENNHTPIVAIEQDEPSVINWDHLSNITQQYFDQSSLVFK